MSLFNQLINGDGLEGFFWEVAIYKGNDETETIENFPTFAEASAFRLKSNQGNKMFIDLWYHYKDNSTPDLVGSNFMEIIKYLENLTFETCTV